MAVVVTVQNAKIRHTCALDTTHRIGAADMAQHYINTHSASDTAPTTSKTWVQGSDAAGLNEDNFQCPICVRHGIVQAFRNLRTADENTTDDSLQTHLVDFHGAA